MSWSIRVEGTVEEIRAEVQRHEREYWRHMPLTERLLVHHLVGHAVEAMDEAATYAREPARRFVLEGSGHETYHHLTAEGPNDGRPISTYGDGDHHVRFWRVQDRG